MAHIETTSGRRSPNVDLNLVPFIDLMSCLITFLLISAVWTQVSMIQLGASFASPKDPTQSDSPKDDDILIRLDLVSSGYILKIGNTTKPIPKKDSVYDSSSLTAELEVLKKQYPSKKSIKIAVSDDIVYEHVIKVMDVGLHSGFAPELLTGGPN